MGKNDMNHLRFLETVALSDCAVLENKESTYKGSWKRAGGGSAWFMARRNLDRLITMMSPKEYPDHIVTPDNVLATLAAIDDIVHYGGRAGRDIPGSIEATRLILEMLGDRFTSEDIFMKIRQAPVGEDGTVLACMRDARRYFMLVEAEMIAEGVIEPESKTYESENYPQDVYTMIADEKRLDRDVVKTLIHDLFYSDIGAKCRIMLLDADAAPSSVRWQSHMASHVEAASPASMDPGPAIGDVSGGGYAREQADRHPPGPITEVDVVFPAAKELSPAFEKVYAGGLVHEQGKPPRKPTEEERAEMDVRRRQIVGDGGSHHAAEINMLWPWHATQFEYDTLHKRVGMVADMFYTRRAAGIFQLESIVGSHTCPIELSQVYEMVLTGDGPTKWVLRRDKVPAELEDNFPRLQLEMNHKEYESTSDFAFMYEFMEGPQKWMVRSQFQAWGRDVG